MDIAQDHTLNLDLDRQSSEALVAFVPRVSIKDHPLLWILVRSQTYYPEHILTYGSGKARCSLVVGSGSFRTDCLEAGWWKSKHHTESGTQEWGLGVQVWTGNWTP